MNLQEIHKFYRGKPPPNAWEGEKMYGEPSSNMKKKYTPKKKKPKTPPRPYYA